MRRLERKVSFLEGETCEKTREGAAFRLRSEVSFIERDLRI